ncbi:MAG: DNA adenine methylase [Mycobacteriales bacterium]
MSRYPSPLRYPGGKGKVANFVKLVMLDNDLLGAGYVEPYAGGASVALSLLFEDYANHIHINDVNPGVHAFWEACLQDPDELCRRIVKTPVTIKTWRAQREVHRDTTSQGIDLAFATFFLNRTNRSGIIAGGVIGGLDQTGPWKIDARYNTAELVARIRKVARFASRITLTKTDAAALLDSWTTREEWALLYLDPPYYVKGGDLYEHFYHHDDHVRIARLVTQLSHPWLVSYDAAPEIIAIYDGETARTYGLHYSANARVTGSEVMYSSPNLVMPREAPAGITARQVADAQEATFA